MIVAHTIRPWSLRSPRGVHEVYGPEGNHVATVFSERDAILVQQAPELAHLLRRLVSLAVPVGNQGKPDIDAARRLLALVGG